MQMPDSEKQASKSCGVVVEGCGSFHIHAMHGDSIEPAAAAARPFMAWRPTVAHACSAVQAAMRGPALIR